MFHRAPNLRDQITGSCIKENEKKHFNTNGFQNCGQYKACTEVDRSKRQKIVKDFPSNDGKTTYKIKDFITCNTENVLYII